MIYPIVSTKIKNKKLEIDGESIKAIFPLEVFISGYDMSPTPFVEGEYVPSLDEIIKNPDKFVIISDGNQYSITKKSSS